MKRILTLIIFVSIVINTNAQWVQTNGPLGGIINAFATLPKTTGGTNLFAALSNNGVFLSTNNGTSWTAVNNGLTNLDVRALAVSGTNLFAGTYGGGVFLSTNNGASWNAMNNGLTSMNVQALAVSGTDLFAGIHNGGIFLSTNNGISWSKSLSNNENIKAFATSGSDIYALGSLQIYRFNNNSWTSYSLSIGGTYYVIGNCMAISGSNIFVGGGNGCMQRSTDNGISWNFTQLSPNSTSSIYSFLVDGTNIYMGTLSGGIYLSTNNGMSWTQINTGLEMRNIVYALAVSSNGAGGTNIFAGTYAGVFRSTNGGANWNQCNNGLVSTCVSSIGISQNGQSGENIYAGTYGGGVFLSTNSGIDYTQINNGFVFTQNILYIYSLAISNTDIYASTTEGNVYHSTDSGSNWIKIYKPSGSGSISSLLASGANIFAGQIGGYVCRSTDNGSNWTKVFSVTPHINNTNVFLASSGSNIFAGTYGGIVYRSTDNGSNWNNVSISATNKDIRALIVSGTNLFAGTDSAGVFLSTNYGSSWTAENNGLTNMSVLSLAVSGTNIFAGTFGGGVFLSTNNGTSWSAVNNGITNLSVMALSASGTNLYVGTNASGIFKRPLSDFNSLSAPNELITTNIGQKSFTANWNAVTGATGYYLDVAMDNGFINYVSSYNNKDVRNITSCTITELSPNTIHYYRIRAYNDTRTSPSSQVIAVSLVGVQDNVSIPKEFSIEQNYPNPFNPTTTINYSVPKSQFVTLKVFDLLGREIATLVNENENAGYYKVKFDASSLTSGIYFYQLRSGNFSETKKLVLLK
jgi:photosystem II stability/assembly factor-like uncharacterized protein